MKRICFRHRKQHILHVSSRDEVIYACVSNYFPVSQLMNQTNVLLWKSVLYYFLCIYNKVLLSLHKFRLSTDLYIHVRTSIHKLDLCSNHLRVKIGYNPLFLIFTHPPLIMNKPGANLRIICLQINITIVVLFRNLYKINNIC
jgi:hypothetical protein